MKHALRVYESRVCRRPAAAAARTCQCNDVIRQRRPRPSQRIQASIFVTFVRTVSGCCNFLAIEPMMTSNYNTCSTAQIFPTQPIMLLLWTGMAAGNDGQVT